MGLGNGAAGLIQLGPDVLTPIVDPLIPVGAGRPYENQSVV